MHHQNLISILSVLCTMAAAAPVTERPVGNAVSKRQATGWPDFCGPQPDASTTDITCILPDATSDELDSLLAALDPKFCQKTADGIICTKGGSNIKRDTRSTPWVLVPLEGSSAAPVKRETPTLVLPPKTPLKDLKVPVPSEFVTDPIGKDKLLIPGAGEGNPLGWEVGGSIGPYKFWVKGKAVDDLVSLDPVTITPVLVDPLVKGPLVKGPLVRVGH